MRKSWERSFTNIGLGYALTLISFNMWGLDTILPIIGTALLYIGFREIKNVNKYFNMGWKCSIIGIVYRFILVLITSTPLNLTGPSVFFRAFTSITFTTIFLCIFNSAVKKLFKDNNIEYKKNPIKTLIIWNIIICVIAFTGLGIIPFLFIIMMIWYFFIINAVVSLRKKIISIAIENKENDIRVNNKVFVAIFVLTAFIFLGITTTIANHLPIKGEKFTLYKTTDIREELVSKGFPKAIINLLSDEDISNIKSPILKVEASTNLLMFDDKTKEVVKPEEVPIINEDGEEDFTTSTRVIYQQVPGQVNLECTSISIQDGEKRMFGVEFFKWKDGGAYFNDGFLLSGSHQNHLISGKLLWDKGNETFISEIPRLTNDFMEGDRHPWIRGAVSYPFKTENQRGYILYEVIPYDGLDCWSANTIFNYYHFNYPFRAVYEEKEKNTRMFDNHLEQNVNSISTTKYDNYK